MAQAQVVFNGASGPVVGGLDWRAATRHKNPSKWARSYSSSAEFTHYVSVTGRDGAGGVGLYVSLVDDNPRPPKGAFSAAAAFAHLAGGDHPSAALVLQARDGVSPQGQDGIRYYVVVLDDGVPVSDLVTDAVTADRLTKGRQLFSDDASLGAGVVPVTFDDLIGAAAASRFKRVPVDLLGPVIAVVMVALVVGGWVGFKEFKKREEARKAQEEAAKADPVPKYLGALSAQRQVAGVSRSDIQEVIARLNEHPAESSGWLLDAMDCSLSTGECIAEWKRKGGTYAELAKVTGMDVEAISADNSHGPDLDKARTQLKVHVARLPLPQKLQPRAVTEMQAGVVLQRWKTAAISVDMGASALWPVVPDVPPSLAAPGALVRYPLVIKDVPGPWVREVVDTAPPSVEWDSIGFSVSESADTRTRLSWFLKGNVYAQQ